MLNTDAETIRWSDMSVVSIFLQQYVTIKKRSLSNLLIDVRSRVIRLLKGNSFVLTYLFVDVVSLSHFLLVL